MTSLAPSPTIITGYKLADNLVEHYTHPLPPLRRLIHALQQALHMPITLVEVEDDDEDEDSTLYVCCYADNIIFREGGLALAGMEVPPAFERVKEILRTEGEVRRRMFCPRGRVYAVEETSD
jgi:hypothetical protein